MSSDVPFRQLVDYAIGGGWGDEQPSGGTMPVRVIRGTDFANIANGAFVEVPLRYEPQSKAERRLLRPGDIVLEISGGSRTSNQSTGRTLLITQKILDQLGPDVIPASFCRLVRVENKSIAPRYAYYALQEMYRSGRVSLYEQHSTGISNFQFEYFLDEERVRLCPFSEQHAIAHVLGTLDDKIELNRRMSETLEEMARALFKSWFVDFDPVRAKAEGRDPGLPKPIADLFPDTFQDSELGEMPKGWGTGTLEDITHLNPESWTKDTRPKNIAYVDLSNTKWGRILSVTPYAGREAPSRAQRVLRRGDTIVGTVRPGNGSYALIAESGLTGSTGFAVLRPKAPEWELYSYLAATSPANIDILAGLADGGAYPAVRPDVVWKTPIILPKSRALSAFVSFASVAFARLAIADDESETLAALRDTLLPKLITGEIRVQKKESVSI